MLTDSCTNMLQNVSYVCGKKITRAYEQQFFSVVFKVIHNVHTVKLVECFCIWQMYFKMYSLWGKA